MKSKQVLDVQQMQHLQELGMKMDYDTLYRYVKFEDTDWLLKPFSDLNIIGISFKYIPAYTLQDVLDALPKEILYENKRCWASIDLEDGFIGYYYENYSLYYKWAYFEAVMKDESIIDAAYELLVWCIDNCYVETNKNE